MNGSSLLHEAWRRGVVLYLDGGRLRFRSPPGALTPALMGALRSRRDELLSELSRREDHEAGPLSTQRVIAVAEGLDGTLLEARTDWGAVRLGTPYGEVWLARTAEVADGLVAERTHLPILLPEDVAALRGKSDEAIRAVLNVRRVFPGGTIQ